MQKMKLNNLKGKYLLNKVVLYSLIPSLNLFGAHNLAKEEFESLENFEKLI